MEKIKTIIKEYEEYCNAGRAQSDVAKHWLLEMIDWFDSSIYEFCGHNAALLGFKRYDKYKFEDIDHLVTKDEYKKMIDDLTKN